MPGLPATLNPRPASDLALCPARWAGHTGPGRQDQPGVTGLVPAGPSGDRTAGVRVNTWTRRAVTYPGFTCSGKKFSGPNRCYPVMVSIAECGCVMVSVAQSGLKRSMLPLGDLPASPDRRLPETERNATAEHHIRPRQRDGGDDLPGMRITLHSPLDCPGCGSRFEGAWIPGEETGGQACPSCGHRFTATWKGWTFTPEQTSGYPR